MRPAAAGAVAKRPASLGPPRSNKKPATMPSMPNVEGDDPVDYRGARIYTSETKGKWRNIMEAMNYETEK